MVVVVRGGGGFSTPLHATVRPSVCLSFCEFAIYLRNGSLVFSDFLQSGRCLEYLKTDNTFLGKFIFAKIWRNRAQNDHKIGFFWNFLKKYCH